VVTSGAHPAKKKLKLKISLQLKKSQNHHQQQQEDMTTEIEIQGRHKRKREQCAMIPYLISIMMLQSLCKKEQQLWRNGLFCDLAVSSHPFIMMRNAAGP
jgi:hypothetical protein